MAETPTRRAPLVPPDADLRGMDYMPLKGERLFNSVFWIDSTPEARCAGIRLWWHAFSKEVPAGTLPDNDRLLAAYAGYGDQVRAWKRVKEQAMRGWFLATDDRLHHETVAEVVIEAWDRRLDHRGETEAKNERQRRWRERVRKLTKLLRDKEITAPRGSSMETLERLCRDAGIDISVDDKGGDVDASRDAVEIAKKRSEAKGSEEKGKEVRVESDSGGGAPPPDQPPPPTQPPTPGGQLALASDDGLDMPVGLDRSPVGQAVALWNETAKRVNAELGHTEWPLVQKITADRRRLTLGRLKDCGGIDSAGLAGFQIALDRASRDRWARGETRRPEEHANWTYNFDYFVKEKTFTKLMEKPHDDDPSRRSRQQQPADRGLEAASAGIDEASAGR